jgi:hypothetical protein
MSPSLGGSGPIKYDDVEWHLASAIESGHTIDAAFVHIGFYLAWLILNDLHAPNAFQDERVFAVRNHDETGSDLADDVDGKLISTMVNDEGAAFTDAYYRSYLTDYAMTFRTDAAFEVESSAENYERIAAVLDRAHEAWVQAGRPHGDRVDHGRSSDFLSGLEVPDAMTPPKARVPSRPTSRAVRVEVRVGEAGGSHVAPALELMLAEKLGLPATKITSVPGNRESSRVSRAIKELGIRPGDAAVAFTLGHAGEEAVMVGLYGVPGVPAEQLEMGFASAIHRPSSRPWETTDIAGHRVLRAADREFVVIYWTSDGYVYRVGAPASADLRDLVGRLHDT